MSLTARYLRKDDRFGVEMSAHAGHTKPTLIGGVDRRRFLTGRGQRRQLRKLVEMSAH